MSGADISGAGQVWSPEGMSQDDFMLKDQCIVVNYMDEVIGHENKYNCHKFLPGQPRGILHRAFSVMLFDAEGNMLLQQRASSKITFPDAWTNTCCSHPLHGMKPSEVDSPSDIAAGNPQGVKHAAIRKINHELGVPVNQLEASRFKFLTRVHYWACDKQTHGSEAPWGEHEIDHLLLYKLKPGEELNLKQLNQDEVQTVKWISREDLREALDGRNLSMPVWSPWFRIIFRRFLDGWWADLDAAVSTNKFVDVDSIHRFDPEEEFHGGAGGAGPLLDALAVEEGKVGKDARRRMALQAQHDDLVHGFVGRGRGGSQGSKQGAYGKVPTHSTSKLDQLTRPFEVAAALRFKVGGLLEDNMKKGHSNPDVAFCDDMLGKVSRSFASVIRQLPVGLCLDICIFYLALRALDTVEDDMEAYKGRESEKQKELVEFGAKRLTDDNASVKGVGEADEKVLIEKFGTVARVFKTLPKPSQDVIMDITNKMGKGMAEYVSADLAQGTKDQAAYDRYCHMVAGLVGEGLSRIFVGRGEESASILGQGERVWPFCPDPAKEPNNLGLANSMGLFLQKTNIIRDYLEDFVDGRAFWPQSSWKKFTKTGDLGEFARPTAHAAGERLPLKRTYDEIAAKGVGSQALYCLNELVADALELVPDSLEYLRRLKTPSVYRFCAIPQIMAMATLAECFNNPRLFTGVVKIRKGLTARLIVGTIDGPDAVHWWFGKLAADMLQSIDSGECVGADEEIGQRLRKACSRIAGITSQASETVGAKRQRRAVAATALVAVATAAAVAATRKGV